MISPRSWLSSISWEIAEEEAEMYPQKSSYVGTTTEVKLDDLLSDTDQMSRWWNDEVMTKSHLPVSGRQTKVVDWYVYDTYGTTFSPNETVQSGIMNWVTKGSVLPEPIRMGKYETKRVR